METSRTEEILKATINGTSYTAPPQSRIEALLLELKDVIEEGGGGSTIKYGGRVDTVNDLPETGEPNQFYFVGLETADNWDEYIWAVPGDDDTGHWDRLGSVAIIIDDHLDLNSTNPVQNGIVAAAFTAVNNAINAVNTALAAKADKTEIPDVSNKLEQSAIAAEYDSTHTYVDGEYMTLNGELYKCDSINGQALPIGENLLVTYADRLKNSAYGYKDNNYWESYGTASITIHNNMYISGSIPIKQNATYRIYESGWPAQVARYFALAMFTNGTNGQIYARALNYGYNGAAASATVSSGSYQYVSMSMPKDEALAAQYSIYELSAQKFVKVTVVDELAGKADTFTTDPTPTASSTNPVQSGGVYTALGAKADLTTFDSMFGAALSHNNIFRGANLTSKYTVAQLYTKVHAGDFSDLYLGDYINVSLSTNLYQKFTGSAFAEGTTYYERSGTHPSWTYAVTTDTEYDSSKTYYTMSVVTETVTMMIAHFDYYYNCGDSSPVTYHHVILIPRTRLKTASYMNPTHTTTGAYYNSEMHQTILPCYAASFSTALENHVCTWRDRLSTEMTAATPSMAGGGLNGSATAWDWKDANIRLMNEAQVYGTGIWSSSAYDYGCENRQLAVFRFISPVQYERAHYWLSSVVSSTLFAFVYSHGNAHYNNAGNVICVRPLIVFG